MPSGTLILYPNPRMVSDEVAHVPQLVSKAVDVHVDGVRL